MNVIYKLEQTNGRCYLSFAKHKITIFKEICHAKSN